MWLLRRISRISWVDKERDNVLPEPHLKKRNMYTTTNDSTRKSRRQASIIMVAKHQGMDKRRSTMPSSQE